MALLTLNLILSKNTLSVPGEPGGDDFEEYVESYREMLERGLQEKFPEFDVDVSLSEDEDIAETPSIEMNPVGISLKLEEIDFELNNLRTMIEQSF